MIKVFLVGLSSALKVDLFWFWHGILVWNFGMDYLLGNEPNSLFVYVWVRENPNFHYKCIFGLA